MLDYLHKRFAILMSAVGVSMTAYADIRAEYNFTAGVDGRFFYESPLYPGQKSAYFSAFFEPELYWEWDAGDTSLLIKPFVRIDNQDTARSHWDLREAMWLRVHDGWELRVGVGKVFWGQTESQHLVDVINQTDMVESVDGEAKLGQPMVNLSLIRDWGTLSFFALPYFREREFAHMQDRFRLPLHVNSDAPLYESDKQERHLDWALRWSHTLGDWDLGLSYFAGTAREPLLVPLAQPETLEPELRPFYPQMRQVGLDALWVAGSWLLKFEGIHRDTLADDFVAITTGFEYTSVGVFDSVFDIGWLMEYQYDERQEEATSLGQNDIMLGSRIVFNDIDGTEVLLALVQDLDNSHSRSGFIEASSRINDHWKWRVDAWFFHATEEDPLPHMLRREDHVQLSLEYYF